jgi:uncharacterized damage-inducible protein DinB
MTRLHVNSTLLEEALEAWQFTREGVIAEAQAVPPGQFEWKPTEKSRTVTRLIHHIVESSLMPAGELTRPDGDFQRAPYSQLLAEYGGHVAAVEGKDALVQLLRDTHEDADRRFREAGELFLLQMIRRFDGKPGTRLAWLYHMVDHESYHRGQLALYVRQLGYVPALTRMILGET